MTEWPTLPGFMPGGEEASAMTYAFDLIMKDGEDLRCEPWSIRNKALFKLIKRVGDGLSYSEPVTAARSGI
jgi:ATP-dependent DNA ligase